MMRLSYSGTNFDFSPRDGYAIPQKRERETYRTPNGDLLSSEIYAIEEYSIPVNNISKADYDNIYAWWNDMRKMTFTPDLAVPGTTITMRFANEENPLTMMALGWATKYEGVLELIEVPALS